MYMQQLQTFTQTDTHKQQLQMQLKENVDVARVYIWCCLLLASVFFPFLC